MFFKRDQIDCNGERTLLFGIFAKILVRLTTKSASAILDHEN